MKKTILSVLMAILVLGLAQLSFGAVGGCFEIEIDVDDDEVKPGESFSVEVEVKNNVSRDIEDIEVEVEVKDIDDGDDLDDDGDLDDLDPNDDDNIEFDFDVPFAVDEEDYDILITVKGDIDNGTACETLINESVKVEKEKHELIMKQPGVDQETLKCSRTTEVAVTLWNIGSKDEDVELEVYNTELGINKKQTFELEKGDDEDDIKSTRRVSLDLTDAVAKTYNFYAKAEYDDGDEYESELFSIKVEDCKTTAPVVPVDDDDDDVVVQPTPEPTPTPVLPPAVTIPAIVDEESFSEQYGTALLLGLAYIVVIVVGVILVVSLLRKRSE